VPAAPRADGGIEQGDDRFHSLAVGALLGADREPAGKLFIFAHDGHMADGE
jgi:hypothetical protein